MINISNQHIDADECTKCPTCGKPSWYIMECDCGNTFCKNCSVPDEWENDCINLKCPECGNSTMYV